MLTRRNKKLATVEAEMGILHHRWAAYMLAVDCEKWRGFVAAM